MIKDFVYDTRMFVYKLLLFLAYVSHPQWRKTMKEHKNMIDELYRKRDQYLKDKAEMDKLLK